jgi:N-acetylglutamate synthase-like GNAT family acetyltransferase
MNPDIQFTESGQLHQEELGDLLRAVGMGPYSVDMLEGVIAGSTGYVTARDGGKLVGFGRVLSDLATLAYINNMAVRPEYQRQGIGQRILELLLQRVEQVRSVYLYTNTADALYLRNGFRLSEKRLYTLGGRGLHPCAGRPMK